MYSQASDEKTECPSSSPRGVAAGPRKKAYSPSCPQISTTTVQLYSTVPPAPRCLFTGKKTPGEPGHTRDTRLFTGTVLVQILLHVIA